MTAKKTEQSDIQIPIIRYLCHFSLFFCICYIIFCNFASVTLIIQQSAFIFSIIITLDILGCYAWRESQCSGLVAPWRN